MIFADTETFSTLPITGGAYRYAEQSEILLFAWARDDEPVRVWDLTTGEHTIDDVREVLLSDPEGTCWHNSNFDRTVLRQHGVIVPTDKIEDTMVLALQHGLPGKLEQLCDVLGVPVDQAKDKDGKKLIQLFTKPRPKNMKLRRATRETHPDEWQRFIAYAGRDVDAMRHVRARTPRWNDTGSERSFWRIDQDTNDRGVAVDVDLARSALRGFERASRSLGVVTSALTDGAVKATTQRDKLLAYLREMHDFTTTDMKKDTVEQLLRDGALDPQVRELLEIRQQAAATSPAKYKALLGAVCSDGRLRGTLQFCGAARTGRDCLAKGTPVLVRDAQGNIFEKPIEVVTDRDMVWDGDNWVSHEGVVYSGDKDVIEHDGVLATAEHIVYLSSTESTTLGEAAEQGLSLWRGNSSPYTS